MTGKSTKPRNDVQSAAVLRGSGMEGEVGDALLEIASAFAKPRNDGNKNRELINNRLLRASQ